MKKRRLQRLTKGASLVEYIILLSLLGGLSVLLVADFGGSLASLFSSSGSRIAQSTLSASLEAQGGSTPASSASGGDPCYNPVNLDTIGQPTWSPCPNMLITSRATLQTVFFDGAQYLVEHPTQPGNFFTIAPSTNQIFTGQITDFSNIFASLGAANFDIGHWDVSRGVNFSAMFSGAAFFDTDLNNWDMSRATNLDFMFVGAGSFNGNIAGWDVSNVQTMNNMFTASGFNRNISGWDVQNVTSMSQMFAGATSFSQDLSAWNPTSTVNIENMFAGSGVFLPTLSPWCTIVPVATITGTWLDPICP